MYSFCNWCQINHQKISVTIASCETNGDNPTLNINIRKLLGLVIKTKFLFQYFPRFYCYEFDICILHQWIHVHKMYMIIFLLPSFISSICNFYILILCTWCSRQFDNNIRDTNHSISSEWVIVVVSLRPTQQFFSYFDGENNLIFNEMMMRSPLCLTNTLKLIFYSASSLKQQSADRLVGTLLHITLIPSQPVFALLP